MANPYLELEKEIKGEVSQPNGPALDLGVTEPVPAGRVDQPLAVVRSPGKTEIETQAQQQPKQNPYLQLEAEIGGSRDAELEALFEAGLTRAPNEHAGVLELARRTGVKADIIEKRMPEFWQKAKAAGFVGQKFRQDNPELAKLLLENPDAAPVAFHDEQVSLLSRVFGTARSVLGFQGKLEPVLQEGVTPEGEPYKLTPSGRFVERGGKTVKQTLQRESPLARELTPEEEMFIAPLGRGPQMLKETFVTAQKQVEYGQLGAELMDRRQVGRKDTWDLEKKITDLEGELGQRYYGAGPVEQVLLDAAEILPSQIQSYKGAGVGAAVGAVAAGGVALAATRSPAIARKAALKGAAVVSRPGVFLASYNQERGSAYLEYLKLKTDDGQQISEETARGAAVLYGFGSAAIETALFPAAVKMLGPAGDAIAAGTGKAYFASLMRDAGARQMLADVGKRWVKGAGAEFKEEFFQSLLQDFIGYVSKSRTAGELQQADLIGSLETGFEAGSKAFTGTLVLGAGGGVVNVGTQIMSDAYARDRAYQAGQQIATLAKVAETSGTARAAPGMVAELVRRETEKSGDPVTHVYVDAVAFSRLFQGEGPKAEEAAVELMGEDGARKLKEALAGANDGKLEVPVADYLDRWGGRKIATVLALDTTVRPGLATTREQTQKDENRQKRRKEIFDQYMAENAPPPKSQAERRLVDAVAVQLARTGIYKPADAREMVSITRAFLFTQAEESGSDPDGLFNDWATVVERENQAVTPAAALAQSAAPQIAEAPQAPVTAEQEIKERLARLGQEQRTQEMYIDPGTGILNERAFAAQPVDPSRPMVAHISVEGVKYANKAGHEVGNALYVAAARALHSFAPDVAKVGGDFAVRVKDQAELDQILARANDSMPAQGFQITGATGATLEAAQEAHIAQKEALEKAGKRAKRGKRPKGLRALSFGEFVRDVWKGPTQDVVGSRLAAVQDTVISESLRQAFGRMTEEEIYRAINVDPTTGFLSGAAFKALKPKKHVVSLDLNKLKKINNKYGMAVGDRIIARFAANALRAGGREFDLAHFSGDEFAAQSDDPAALQEFIDSLGALCDNVREVTPGGKIIKGITFGYGIGDSYAIADQAVEAHKRKGVRAERRARKQRIADREKARAQAGREDLRGRAGQADRRRPGRPFAADQEGPRPVGERLFQADKAVSGATNTYRVSEIRDDELRVWHGTTLDSEWYPYSKTWKGGVLGFLDRTGGGDTGLLYVTNTPKRAARYGNAQATKTVSKAATKLGPRAAVVELAVPKSSIKWLKRPESHPTLDQVEDAVKEWRILAIHSNETGLVRHSALEELKKRLSRTLKQGGRGYVDRMREGMKRIFKVVLTDKADLSTFLHESSHIFLDVMGDLATREGANERLTADWSRTLEWLGVKDYSEIGREQHEKWARAFETYLREGKAPSAALVSAFQRFKLWLTQIYRALAPGEIDDEIRGVFDRMLATDDEIARMRRAMGAEREFFRSPEEAGMSPSEWQSYLDDRDKAFARATAQTQRQVIDQKIKATRTYLREERSKALEDAGKEYDARSEVVAYNFLKNGQAGENEALKALLGEAGSPPGLNLESVILAVGDEVTRTKFRGLTEQGGLDPDELAEIVGIEDGATLLKQLAGLPDKLQWSRSRATEILHDRAGDVEAERQRLEEEAAKALHGEGNSDWLLKEWQALRRRRGEGGAPAPLESIRLAARDIVEATPVRALRPGRVLQAERSAANRAAVAAAKKDWRAAVLEKQKQLLNHYIHRETTLALDSREKFERLADKLTDRKRREALGKAGKTFIDAADSILEALGFADPETDPQALAERKTTPEWMAALEEQGILPGFAGDRLSAIVSNPPGSWRDLSVADVEMLRTALSQLYRAARDVNQVILLGKRVQIQQVLDQIAEESAYLPSQPAAPASESQRTLLYRARQALQGIDAVLTDPEQLLGSLGQTARQFFWDRYTDQRTVEDQLAEKVLKFFLDSWNDLPKELQRRKHEPMPASEIVKLPFPADVRREVIDKKGRVKIDRAWMWMLALNTGNRSNLDRLLGGYGWDEQAVRDFLSNNMTEEEWDFVESVWELMDKELYPQVAKQYESVNGIRPKKIEALPWTLPSGRVIRGGYFPARYDPVASRLGQSQREEALSTLYNQKAGQYSISKGFTKERAKTYEDVISLQWNEVPRHVAQVIHYIAFDGFMRDAGRVMAGLQGTVGERLGDKYYPQLEQWLRVVASPVADMTPEHLGPLVSFMGGLRSRFVISTLGYSLTVAGGDLTNSLVAISSGKVRSRFAVPAHIRAFTDWSNIRAMSKELPHRSQQWRANLRKDLMQVGPAGQKSVVLEAVRESAWWMMEWTDRIMSTIIWKGAYDQARSAKRYGGKELSHDEAVRDADSVVRAMLPTHDPAEQPAILRDKRGIGSLIAFYGYFSKLYNVQRETLAPALLAWQTAEGVGEKVKTIPTAAHAAGRVLATIIVTELLAELLSGRGPEDEEKWGEWAMRKALAAPGMYIPLLGPITEQASNFAVSETVGSGAKYRRPSVRAAPAAAAFDRMARALSTIASTEKEPDERIFAFLEAAGVLANLPLGSSQVQRTGKYVAGGGMAEDVASGRPGEVVEGLIYGRRDNQPKNVADLVTDIAEGNFP